MEIAATASTAARNALSFDLEGLLKPLIFLTYCKEAARTSSSVTGGSKLKSILIFRHIFQNLKALLRKNKNNECSRASVHHFAYNLTAQTLQQGAHLNLAYRSIASLALLASASLSYAQLEGSKPDTRPAHHPVPSIQDTETPAQRDARMQWWREARFGMFIHWGLYSIPAGTWQGKQIPGIGE